MIRKLVGLFWPRARLPLLEEELADTRIFLRGAQAELELARRGLLKCAGREFLADEPYMPSVIADKTLEEMDKLRSRMLAPLINFRPPG